MHEVMLQICISLHQAEFHSHKRRNFLFAIIMGLRHFIGLFVDIIQAMHYSVVMV